MSIEEKEAPGKPGIAPKWTTSAKSGVGTAIGPRGRVWFSLSHGIFNEIYYPRVDQACTRDFGMIVTDGKNFFSEEKRHTEHKVEYLEKGVPVYRLTNTCLQGRYRIEKEIICDPLRESVMQRTHFTALKGNLSDYHVYVLLSPHLGNQGSANEAWVGEYKGHAMLFAQQGAYSLALACSTPWLRRSVGFVGTSDGWQDLNQHKQMTWEYSEARSGNVALTGEIDIQATHGEFVLAVGFGNNPAEAAYRALASLQDGFDAACTLYVQGWKAWQDTISPLDESSPSSQDLYRISTAVLRIHESSRFPGGLIASLSIPWGDSKGDDDLGGYHLVWPRDLAESAGGLLAAGAREDVYRVLHYLQATQEADGCWPQNMWLDGRPYWSGIQVDETAFPILLVDLASRQGVLDEKEIRRLWPMVRNATGFLLRNGPVTQEDRWEEDPGYSPFTLAVEIAALLVAADLADRQGEKQLGEYLRSTADTWNENIERWVYVSGTDLAREAGVEGYYVRIAPPDMPQAASPLKGYVPIKNRPPGQSSLAAEELISPDALALVRFGLRAANDPRILNTVKVIDRLLKVDTPNGPAWHRYNQDGYGEHEDGNPFDGTGIGRAWPLLTGERAHYELAAGNRRTAERLLHAMEKFSGDGGLISEQIWDAEDIPEKELFKGRPSGSAMPLVWAHAEYVKLRRSLRDKRVFDMPPQTYSRYAEKKTTSPFFPWRFNLKVSSIPKGKKLRIETLEPAVIHWSIDDWETPKDIKTRDTGFGVHLVDLPTGSLDAGQKVLFTLYYPEKDSWESQNYEVKISSEAKP